MSTPCIIAKEYENGIKLITSNYGGDAYEGYATILKDLDDKAVDTLLEMKENCIDMICSKNKAPQGRKAIIKLNSNYIAINPILCEFVPTTVLKQSQELIKLYQNVAKWDSIYLYTKDKK